MKNIAESMKKTAIYMKLVDFEDLIDTLTDEKCDFCIEDGEMGVDDNTFKKLSEHFDIKITSIIADSCDTAGIWIIYQPDPEPQSIANNAQTNYDNPEFIKYAEKYLNTLKCIDLVIDRLRGYSKDLLCAESELINIGFYKKDVFAWEHDKIANNNKK